MKASVIVPTYKRTAYLLEALQSVREQAFPSTDYEIVIVDNASRAIPELAVLHHPLGMPPIRYIHEAKPGLHHARHAGARAAQGEILVYIDDDVICPPGWLAAMVEPYRHPRVAMVAGKVELLYEGEPPAWLAQFRGILSALDWGDSPQALPPFRSPVGCNMSLRRSVLFAVGGFNPDGFGEHRLLRFRGDGEVGLARKVHEAGFLIWYAPEAWLWHRVPKSRMTREYVCWRSQLAGVEAAYVELRYQRRSVPGLCLRGGGSLLKSLYHRFQETWHRRNEVRRFSHAAAACRHWHRAWQFFRQAVSPALRRYARQQDYLT